MLFASNAYADAAARQSQAHYLPLLCSVVFLSLCIS